MSEITINLGAFNPPAPKTGSDDPEIVRLRATNELWAAFSPLWNFYLSAYEGGTDFANTQNLFKHIRETEPDFEQRALRIHNLNYCEPLVDFFTNFIFSESIDRSDTKNAGFYGEFTKDVNRKKESVDDFMRQVSDDSQIFGMVYVLVDAPSVKGVLTQADEQAQGIRPYWVLIKPDEITDWIVDDFGAFQYAKRRQLVRLVSASGIQNVERYTEFYVHSIVVSEIDVTDPASVVLLAPKTYINSIGKVPLVTARYKRSKRYPHMGLSFLRDFAANNREVMNLTSLLQEFLYRQAFNILAKEVDDIIPQAAQQEGVVGTANMLDVPKGAKFPQYISPASDPAQFIAEERGRIINEMFKRAAQDALNELFNGEKKSGFSQAQSFSKTVPFIASRADVLEGVENELMQLTMALMGKTWEGKIKYKDRYELTNLTDALTQLQIIVRDFVFPSETFVKAELKRMAFEYDGKLPVDQVTKIMKEIDDMDFKDWLDLQKEALVGKSAVGTSPSAQQQPKNTGTMKEVAAEANMPGNAATNKVQPKVQKK